MTRRSSDPETAGFQNGLARLAYLSVAVLVTLVVGVPLLLVGLLAVLLDGIAWPAIAGFVAIALSFVLGLVAYRWLLESKRELEAPRRRNQVFISYRTAEHGPYAQRLVEVLHGAGIDVFFASSGEVTVDADRPYTELRALGLFQMGGLDGDLQRGLIESDAVVYFVPLAERRLGAWQVMKDTVDGLIAWLMFQSGLTIAFWRSFWYASVYGRTLTPAVRIFDLMSWQAWELAMARQLDLAILKVIVDGGSAQLDEEGILCHSDSLESDYRTKILPRLQEAVRTELKVEGPLPIMGLAAVISAALVVVLVVTVLALALYLIARLLF